MALVDEARLVGAPHTLALLFIVQEPIYNFVAATWVSHNIYFQDAMSTITR
ncbi:hypothetical protein HFO55_35130 [Rhizobium leguminosarum]|uniref:hypothetical protein n=1 Tax=Rhizobium leguminosarum TaxID=384 RepID=UPI001C94270D|nr:hypothetical protein [Rhizobium leguminosarum]MBY5572325.1 hypothetical protein [Rhizobium leguminosarum]MBY5579011.1 hypothetical protein [Rhizobium leguminosarum]